MRIKTATPENRAKAETLRRDVAEYEALRASRTLTKPPLRTETRMFTSGARALARDIKTGVYEPGRALLEIESQRANGFAGSESDVPRVWKVSQ